MPADSPAGTWSSTVGTGDGRWLFRLARGGAPNLIFVHERAEALPGSLRGMAAEVYVQYPWGGLLRAVTGGEAANLVPPYAAAGLRIVRRETAAVRHRSSWAGRLGQGRALLTLCVEADLVWPPCSSRA